MNSLSNTEYYRLVYYVLVLLRLLLFLLFKKKKNYYFLKFFYILFLFLFLFLFFLSVTSEKIILVTPSRIKQRELSLPPILMQVSDSFGIKVIPSECEICFRIIRNPVRLNARWSHSDWARSGTQPFGLNGEWHGIIRNEFALWNGFKRNDNFILICAESFGINLRKRFGLKKNESQSNRVIRTFTTNESVRRKQISHSFIIDRNESEMHGLKRNRCQFETCIR